MLLMRAADDLQHLLEVSQVSAGDPLSVVVAVAVMGGEGLAQLNAR